MKLIIICSNYEPGGAQRVVFRLVKSLRGYGIDAELYFLHRKSKNFSRIEPKLIYNQKLTSVNAVIIALTRLFKLFKSKKPDVVLSFLPYANTLGLMIARISGVKRRIASHRNDSDIDLSLIMKWVDSLCANRGLYTSIIAVSEPTKLSFKHYNKNVYENIKVINNGLDVLVPKKTKFHCRKTFNLCTDEFIIGSVGRLVPQKNHLFLIELLPNLNNVKLIIVGKGELEEHILERAKKLGVSDQVQLINEVRAEQMMMFLKSLDIFVMPSIVEGMSNSLLEALHSGLPIIASDVPSQRNVLYRSEDNRFFGYLIDLNNPEKWVKILKYLKNNPLELKKMGELSHQRSKDFSLDKMSQEYLNLILDK